MRYLRTSLGARYTLRPLKIADPQRPKSVVLSMAGLKTFNQENSSKGHVLVAGDHASYEGILPGWSFSDLSTFLPLEHEPWYLRVWRVPLFMESVKEVALKHGFFDYTDYEKTNLVYYKCSRTERIIPVEILNDLGRFPFQYSITVKGYLASIGRTSFQVDSIVTLSETGSHLFRNSVVIVCVNMESRKVEPLPDWWVKKFSPCLQQSEYFEKLRLDLPKSIKPEDILFKSKRYVQAMDIDYYGHVNNNIYPQYAADAILAAQMENKLPWTAKEVENGIKQIDMDFVSDCKYGDLLETVIHRDEEDPCRIHVSVMKGTQLIHSQSLLYESPHTGQKQLKSLL